jgi:hypothetical protein
MQHKFAAVCFYRFTVHSLRKQRHHLYALFFVQVYRGLRSCPSLLENVSLHVPTCCVRDLPKFSVCISVKHSPVRCVNAASMVTKCIGLFKLKLVSLKHILLSLLLVFLKPAYYLLVYTPFLMFYVL